MHPNPTYNRVHEKLLFELASPISSQQWDTCSSLYNKKQIICMRQLMPFVSFLFCWFNDLYFAPAKYSWSTIVAIMMPISNATTWETLSCKIQITIFRIIIVHRMAKHPMWQSRDKLKSVNQNMVFYILIICQYTSKETNCRNHQARIPRV